MKVSQIKIALTMRAVLLPIAAQFIMLASVYSAHIIGGVMSYECTGEGSYRITLKVYRDCAGGGAAFDSANGNAPPGTVTVYQGDNIYAPYASLALAAPVITRLDPEGGPCLIVPPNVCVEEGIYVFDLLLPLSDQPYHIAYQRCCRNNSIANLASPESTGATFTISILPAAQLECNSSPEFRNFPPLVVCAGERLVFDHSAIDPDTTVSQITYSLCEPFAGGGLRGSELLPGDPTLLDGIVPDPEPPPPYIGVDFLGPLYDVNNPLGTGSLISLDPNTGLLIVEPQLVGQFVVGICARELRNGVVISEIRRDFQFNVTQCSRLVQADIEADRQTIDGTFEILSCGDLTVTINNLSQRESAIEGYLWEVPGVPGGPFTSRDLTLTFPDTGFYDINMFLNPDLPFGRCKDTARISLGVFGSITSDFAFDYDTCEVAPVDYEAMAISENGPVTSYEWTFGDGSEGIGQTVSHEFITGGVYDVRLIATDDKGCSAEPVQTVRYFPVPDVLLARPDRFLICVPEDVTFNALNEVLTDDYEYMWFFGDGGVGEGRSPTHTYERPGRYDVEVIVTSPIGCETEATFRGVVEARASPQASFTLRPDEVVSADPEVTFTSTSTGADQLQWFFGDGDAATGSVVVHNYPDSGLYEAIHIAVANNGCTDTARAIIDVIPFASYFLPNAFTPNNDGINDIYVGTGIQTGVRSFVFRIYNRWGAVVFESDDPDLGWNGRLDNTGENAPKGVYQCVVQYVTSRGEQRTLEETVTLLR